MGKRALVTVNLVGEVVVRGEIMWRAVRWGGISILVVRGRFSRSMWNIVALLEGGRFYAGGSILIRWFICRVRIVSRVVFIFDLGSHGACISH